MAIADALNAHREFSYQSLVTYNSLMNELFSLEQMPTPAGPTHYRALREFISRFLILCYQHKVGLVYLEPLLIANVVAAFNHETFCSWRSQVIQAPATLASIRAFLATQEELAGDQLYATNRLTLARAVRNAQQEVRQGQQSANQVPVKLSEQVDKKYYLPKNKAEVEQMKKASCAQVARNNDAGEGPSDWQPPVNRNISPYQRANVQPGSVSGGNQGASAKASKKDDKKRAFKCFSCGGAHQLYYCPRFDHSTMEQRWDFVRANRICPLCLLEQHSLLECHVGHCKNCKKNNAHNSMLCGVSYQRKKQQPPPKKDDDGSSGGASGN